MKSNLNRLFAASATSLIALASSGYAQTTWNGSTDASWVTPTNWSAGVPDGGDLVTYGAGNGVGIAITNPTQTLDGAQSALGFTFGNSNLVTINAGTGGSLTIGTSGILLNSSSGAGVTVNADIALSGNQTWTTGNNRNLTANNVSLGTNTLSTNIAGTGAITIDGEISGTGGVTRAGGGTALFTLTGTNTYTGTTTINQGILRVTGSGVLGGATGSTGDASNIVFGTSNANATLQFQTAANLGAADQIRFRNTGGTAGSGGELNYIGTTDQTVGKTLQCDSSIGIRLGSDSVEGSITYNGAFSINSSRPLFLEGTGSGDNTLSMAFAGSAITKRDAGKWILNAANSYGGATTISGGILQIGSGSTTGTLGSGAVSVASGAELIFNRSNALTVANVISGAGNLTKKGAGRLTVSGNNSGGSLKWNFSGTGNGDIGYQNSNAIGATGSSITLADSATGSVFFVTTGNTTDAGISLGADSVFTWNGSTNNTNTLSGEITGSGTFTKISGETLILSGNSSSYNGDVNINVGALVINGNISNSLITVASGATLSGDGGTVGSTIMLGNLNIGASPGTMTFAGDLTLGATSISNFEINGFTAGNFDLATTAEIGTQNVNFNGGILNILFLDGFNTTGSVKIFDFDGYSGNTTTFNTTGLASGYTASFDYLTGTVTVIPEPSAALIGGLGLLVLLRRRHR